MFEGLLAESSSLVIEGVLTGEPVVIKDSRDGNYVYVGDVVDAYLKLIEA